MTELAIHHEALPRGQDGVVVVGAGHERDGEDTGLVAAGLASLLYILHKQRDCIKLPSNPCGGFRKPSDWHHSQNLLL